MHHGDPSNALNRLEYVLQRDRLARNMREERKQPMPNCRNKYIGIHARRLANSNGSVQMINAICIFLSLAAGAVGIQPDATVNALDSKLTQPPTDGEIEMLVDALSDADYSRRSSATRRLCAIGMPAHALLAQAAKSSDTEAALRARSVLDVLDNLMFTGLDIQLSVSKSKIEWSEPIELILQLRNRSAYPSRIPFAAPSDVDNEETRIGLMLDLSEVLSVRRADGHEIELTIDDITANRVAARAVQQRLTEGPTHVIQPGETVTYRARAFNRNWARYRLLDAGYYKVHLDYIPQWSDDVLADQRVWRVVSHDVKVLIATGAPEQISRVGSEASIRIRRDEDDYVAQLTNRTDQVLFVNQNFGAALPFADGRWIYDGNDSRRVVPLRGKQTRSLNDFDARRLTPIQPGTSIELARINTQDLHQSLIERGATLDTHPWDLHFAYMNLCNRKWQEGQRTTMLEGQNVPEVLKQPLPQRILMGRHTSNQITSMPEGVKAPELNKPAKPSDRAVPAG